MKQIVKITDDKGQVHLFDTFRGLIDYANKCGSMGFLPDGFTCKVLTIGKKPEEEDEKKKSIGEIMSLKYKMEAKKN